MDIHEASINNYLLGMNVCADNRKVLLQGQEQYSIRVYSETKETHQNKKA